MAGLVGGDRHEPRPEVVGLADGPQLAPGDEPGRLHRVEGQVLLAADAVGDADHVRLVGRHDSGERGLVPGDCLLQRRGHRPSRRETRHTRERLAR